MLLRKFGLTVFLVLSCVYSSAHEKRSFTFIDRGWSLDLDSSKAELNMLADARDKCDAIEAPIQISDTKFRSNPKILYASAEFACQYSALDRRKCNYVDDSNPDCRDLRK